MSTVSEIHNVARTALEPGGPWGAYVERCRRALVQIKEMTAEALPKTVVLEQTGALGWKATLDGRPLGEFNTEQQAREEVLRVMREDHGLVLAPGETYGVG